MIMRFLYIGLVFLLSATAFCGELKHVTSAQQKGTTSLYLTIKGPFTHKLLTLTAPNRVVVDLGNTHSHVSLSQMHVNNGLVQRVRGGQYNANTVRLVFDVRQKVRLVSAPWRSREGFNGVRIDLVALKETTSRRLTKPIQRGALKQYKTARKTPAIVNTKPQHKSPQHQVQVSQKPIAIAYPTRGRLRDVIVVLDAGHGGKDPGARGPGKSREKEVVLAITLKLKRLIDRQRGMHAVLTRSGDYYVGLRQRLDRARKYNGDIFVSIHADAFNNPYSNGASVFALSPRGATSEAARWLAEKENYSELGGVNLGGLDDQNGVVRSVLIDLSQTATINAGLEMGGRVLRQIGGLSTLHHHKVEQARFVVLKSPDIPSILVETGFISNPREERNLNSSAYQDKLSQAIFQGIKGYFWENPPRGSRIEAMTTKTIHIVKAGENIPFIAAKYHVSITSIQAANLMRGKLVVRSGQKLVIPSQWA
jgi:N-acetylmuramoyl-L-alanine amidase